MLTDNAASTLVRQSFTPGTHGSGLVGIALGGRGNPQPCFRDLSVSSSAPTPEIQVHSLPSRYELGKSDIDSNVRKRRKRTRAIEDPAYDTIHHHHHRASGRRDSAGRDIRRPIILLSNDEYHCRYDKPHCPLPYRQQTKIPATRLVLIISCLSQAARRQGLESKPTKHILV
ncbi:hypothetical protein Q7P35_010087 [Cladosporium inversicolor]